MYKLLLTKHREIMIAGNELISIECRIVPNESHCSCQARLPLDGGITLALEVGSISRFEKL